MMKIPVLRRVNIAFLLLLFAAAASAQTTPPSIFFTDLASGPSSGGESVGGFSGAYVTIYGNNFGASQGSSTVTWAGQNCLRIVSWGQSWLWYQKIVVQFGSSCTAGTGTFAVTVNGTASTTATVNLNGAKTAPSQFTVRSGNIRCVSSSGSDSANGTFPSSCWKTIQHAIQTISAGDIAYVQTLSEGSNCSQYNAATCILSSGSAGSPKAIVAYPGATVTINSNLNFCMRTPAVSGPGPHWVIAGLSCTVTGNGEGFALGEADMRVVANSISCPNSFGTAACFDGESDGTSNAFFVYGNVWNNVGTQVNGQKTYHAAYFSKSDDHTDVGWNDLHQIHGCRAIQFYDASGRDMGDIHVHDNVIHVVCDAINFSTMNSDEAGGVEAYNNVMYNVGSGPNPPDGQAVYSCVNTDSVNSHSTPVKVYNNTCYNAGFSGGGSGSGCFNTNLKAQFVNNICDQANGQPYFATGAAGCSSVVVGSTNNDWFGNGSVSCGSLSNNLTIDPKVVSAAGGNFGLQSGSPMLGAGSGSLFPTLDHNGLVRDNPPSVGAHELVSGTAASLPEPPTNLTVTVVN
jgi:hypothetical protein